MLKNWAFEEYCKKIVFNRWLIPYFLQTIADDSTGTSQNSISADRGSSPSNDMAGILQNQSSASQLSPYFPSSTNAQTTNLQPVSACSQLATQAVVRSIVQLHQTVSYQLVGQTATMSSSTTTTTTTTQATTSTGDCPAPITQQMVTQANQSSPFVEDMAWVSWSLYQLRNFRIHLILNV